MKKLKHKGRAVTIVKEFNNLDCGECIFSQGDKCKAKSALAFEKKNKLKECGDDDIGVKYIYA